MGAAVHIKPLPKPPGRRNLRPSWIAIGLIVLLIYKSTLTMHEDDQLFLDEANSHMQEEQTELLTKVGRLTIPMRVFSIGSGVFALAFLALLIYQKLNEVQ